MGFWALDDCVYLLLSLDEGLLGVLRLGQMLWVGGGQPIMKIRRHRRVYYTSHFVSSCKLLQRKNTSHKLDLLMRIDEKHQMINIQISH